jgi:hypothetical protein
LCKCRWTMIATFYMIFIIWAQCFTWIISFKFTNIIGGRYYLLFLLCTKENRLRKLSWDHRSREESPIFLGVGYNSCFVGLANIVFRFLGRKGPHVLVAQMPAGNESA